MGRLLLTILLMLPLLARAADVADAAGRVVHLPDHISRILPAGPPAAVLLAALAPDLMIGGPHQPSQPALSFLNDTAARLPQVPHLTSKEDVLEAIKAAAPDMILDY